MRLDASALGCILGDIENAAAHWQLPVRPRLAGKLPRPVSAGVRIQCEEFRPASQAQQVEASELNGPPWPASPTLAGGGRWAAATAMAAGISRPGGAGRGRACHRFQVYRHPGPGPGELGRA